MQKTLQARYGKRLPSDLVVKIIRKIETVHNFKYSLELLKIQISKETTVFIIHGFNSKIGCTIEFFNYEDALKLWNSILVEELTISEWYIAAKKTNEQVKGFSIYSQTTGSWFDCYFKMEAFESALTTVL